MNRVRECVVTYKGKRTVFVLVPFKVKVIKYTPPAGELLLRYK